LFVAITVKALSVAERFSDALITVVVVVAIFGGAITVDILKSRR